VSPTRGYVTASVAPRVMAGTYLLVVDAVTRGGEACRALFLAMHGCRGRGHDLTCPHKHPTTQQCMGQFLTGDAVGPKDETLPPRAVPEA
jgi:hypothetical protein